MEIIEIIGIDPALRHTGIAKVSYNTETKKLWVSDCMVINCPPKFKGYEAIMYTLNRIEEIASEPCYSDASKVVIESPPNVFNPKFPVINFIQCAHIVGGAASLFGLDRSMFCAPIQWNKKNKEKTHKECLKILGEVESWHFKEKPFKTTLEHMVDAVCIAYWHLNEEYIKDDV